MLQGCSLVKIPVCCASQWALWEYLSPCWYVSHLQHFCYYKDLSSDFHNRVGCVLIRYGLYCLVFCCFCFVLFCFSLGFFKSHFCKCPVQSIIIIILIISMNNFLEIDVMIKTTDKKLRRFDLPEVIFKCELKMCE